MLKTAETLLVCCVAGLALFIGKQALAASRDHPSSTASTLAAANAVRASAREAASFGTISPDVNVVASAPVAEDAARRLDPRDLRIRLSNGATGTYIDDLIVARDSAVTRWPDRRTRPLRVWIAEAELLDGWNTDFVSAVRDAFDTWVHVGIPVHFTFIADSTTADVRVGFVTQFSAGISGKTVWSRNEAFWLVSSDIMLGIAHPGGGAVSAPQMRAIALHEVGHLLGLDHSLSPDNIMSARIRVRELTEADRATVRLLYSVPAGSVK